MSKTSLLIILATAGLTTSLGTHALELPDIISDNAVVQQLSDARLWGWSKPGATVSVTPSWEGGATLTATAGADGRWDVTVATPAASFTPYEITFADADTTITIGNVLAGEVWLASGQSNMEMPLRGFWTQPVAGAAQAIAYSGRYPGVRVATVPKLASYKPESRAPGKWKVSAPENAGEFSAVGYFFARSLSDILGVPVGIISCAYGGSKVEGWIPREKLATYPGWDMDREEATPADSLNEWERIGVMYNAMLHPLIGYNIKGIIWNQGESNVGRHDEYPAHQADMVEIWRNQWGLGELPFYFVELPSWNYGNPDGIDAALFRECQHRSAGLIPSSGIVSTADLVLPGEIDDIHASRKQEIGERLAFMAAGRTYGKQGIASTYPTFRQMKVDGRRAVLDFDNADAGFTPNDVLEGFEAAGSDHVFHPAKATEDLSTRRIVVECDSVDRIEAVHYGFRNFAPVAVKDMMGMPLVPFRTDNWQ